MAALFKVETDPVVAERYVEFLIWAEVRECLPFLVAWRDSLQKHAEDAVAPNDGRNPRFQWIRFAIACDALGDHSATQMLLEQVKRNFEANQVSSLIKVSLLSDPAVLSFLESLLNGEFPSDDTRRWGWLSWTMCMLTAEDGVAAVMSIGGDYPTRAYWIEWLARNKGKLHWVAEPPTLSRSRCYRVGWWRVQDR